MEKSGPYGRIASGQTPDMEGPGEENGSRYQYILHKQASELAIHRLALSVQT